MWEILVAKQERWVAKQERWFAKLKSWVSITMELREMGVSARELLAMMQLLPGSE
jgi:hypothetical protein